MFSDDPVYLFSEEGGHLATICEQCFHDDETITIDDDGNIWLDDLEQVIAERPYATEVDHPEHCEDCGKLLDTNLTSEGAEYITEPFRVFLETVKAHKLWEQRSLGGLNDTLWPGADPEPDVPCISETEWEWFDKWDYEFEQEFTEDELDELIELAPM